MTTVVFGEPLLENAVDQLNECMTHPAAVAGALMADHHVGYSMPIGGVIAYQDAISPSGVGYDIACGNKAVRTSLRTVDIGGQAAVKTIMREIQRRVKFGLGGRYAEASDHTLFADPLWYEINALAPGLRDKAREQLGTVGTGNHYVDLLYDSFGYVWIANHFGSRGFGHTIATGAMNLSENLPFSAPRRQEAHVVLSTSSELGAFYIAAMQLAGSYAYAGRDFVIDQVLDVLGNPTVQDEVHNHHNFAWLEDGLWVVRKGATPLVKDEPAYIGGSMGEGAAIVYGTGDDVGDIHSAPHGAGRVLSRNQAAGKHRKFWVCGSGNRDCEYRVRAAAGEGPPATCPTCGPGKFRKLKLRDSSTALIDWQEQRALLAEQGVVVLGGDADESPPVYKSLRDVLDCHPNLVVRDWLEPWGVVMASPEVFDPYKD